VNQLASTSADTVRSEIRVELETTRTSFHELLSSISAEDWSRRSGNLAWTVGEVMYHMTLALRLLPSDVRLIRSLAWAPKLPAFLFDWLIAALTRLGARRQTRFTVAEEYEAAHATVLQLLETIQEDEWGRGMDYPAWDPLLSGYVTLERLFRYPAVHFESHAEQVRSGLKSASAGGRAHGV
jgi:hypothetical protein